MRPFLSSFRPLLLAGAVALLSACGSDDPAAGAGDTTATGTLTDSPIAGVSYSASPSGKSGVTTAEGKFNYVPGDTVIFRLGELELGRIKAEGEDETVTPIQLVGDASDTDRVTNLLVLLQSLDDDGNPNDGITILPAVTAAVTADVAATLELALGGDPDAFDAAGTNPALDALVTIAGSGGIRSKEDALAHFKYRFMLDLPGTYLLRQGENVLTLRINYEGRYLMGTVGGQSGIERGNLDWNPASGEITVVPDSVDLNTDGNGGLHGLTHALGFRAFLALDGTDLLLRASTGGEKQTLRFARVGSSATTLLGAFTGGSATSFSVPQFIFLNDGHYVLVDPEGTARYAVGGEPTCAGSPGIEYGSFVLSSNQLVTTPATTDTNGCAGLYDSDSQAITFLTPVSVRAGGVYVGESHIMQYPIYVPRR